MYSQDRREDGSLGPNWGGPNWGGGGSLGAPKVKGELKAPKVLEAVFGRGGGAKFPGKQLSFEAS